MLTRKARARFVEWRGRAVGSDERLMPTHTGRVASSTIGSTEGKGCWERNDQERKTEYPYGMVPIHDEYHHDASFFAGSRTLKKPRSRLHLPGAKTHRRNFIAGSRSISAPAHALTPARVRLPPRERVGRHSGRHGRRLPAPGVSAESAARESGAPRFASPVRARVSTCCRPILARGLPAVLRRRRLFTPNLPSRRHRARPDRPF